MAAKSPAAADDAENKTGVLIEEVHIRDAEFVMLPRDRAKKPLRFAIHQLNAEIGGHRCSDEIRCAAHQSDAARRDPERGSFWPVESDEPGDTPLNGDYRFDHADLGVFHGIAGILSSTGRFEGELDTITARGEATVPDFRLKRSGNRVPLKAQYRSAGGRHQRGHRSEARGRDAGRDALHHQRVVFKNEGDAHRQIHLEVNMPNGRMRDVLLLAMKDSPFMEGTLRSEDQAGDSAAHRQGGAETPAQWRISRSAMAHFLRLHDSGSDR